MNLEPWLFYARFLTVHKKKLTLPLLALIIISLITIPLPYFVISIFQNVIPSGSIRILVATGVLLILVNILQGVMQFWIRAKVISIVKLSVEQFRDEIVARLCALSRIEYIRTNRGELHSRIVHDTEQLDTLGNLILSQILPAVAIIIPLSLWLVWLNWYLFVISFAVFPLLLYIGKILGTRIDRRVRAFHKALNSFSSSIHLALNAMDLTRIQSAEEFERERQRKQFSNIREMGNYLARSSMAYQVIQTTVSTSFSFLVLIIGGIAVIQGHLTVAALISFYVLTTLLKAQVNTIIYLMPPVIQAKQSLSDLYSFLSIENSAPYNGKRHIPFHGNVRIEGVSFKYGEAPLLHNINLIIPAGTIVAVQGANGSGKSTLVSLILGLYRPLKGELFADDHPYSDLDIVDFRRSLGVVMQDPMIFPGSVLDNLTYGSNEFDYQQVVHAAEISTAHDFIQQLPGKYETEVGDRGVLLSGGQCQRIAIARALLRRPKLLILDEPTTHIDAASIRRLMQNLRDLHPAPAIVLIGHDRIITEYADEIYMLEHGTLRAVQSELLDQRN